MEKPKIRFNKEGVSEQEALEFKSFSKLLSSFNTLKKSKGKNNFGKYLIGGLATIAVLGFFFVQKGKELPIAPEKNLSVIQEIKRPFPDIPVEYELFVIKADEQTVIKSAHGSVITIQANSIVDSSGKPVVGEIELKYRELRDMVDVFLSGIPMDYDTAGTKKHFESAGMFELLAYQNNKPLFIQPDKKITIAFASQYEGDRYNIYHFDMQTQRWEFMYKDTSKSHNKIITNKIELINEEIVELKKSVGTKPILANPKRISIKLDVLESEFPEIALYSNVRFQILEGQKINPQLDTLEWDVVKVEKNEGEDGYLLHFERGTETKEFACIPVFNKEDYANAKKLFEEKHKASLALIKEKTKEKEKLVKKYKEERTSQQTSLATSRFVRQAAAVTLSSEGTITRIFQINKFGVFNSDCPTNLPKGSLFALNLVDKDSVKQGKVTKSLNFGTVYLVEKNKNMLYTYYNINEFSYNPKSKNLLWTVTLDNKLAVFSYADFDGINTIGKGEGRTLKMKVVSVNFKNKAQILKYLEI